MAKATVLPPPEPEVEVQLTLTADEARILMLVLARISGDPFGTFRALTGAIRDALDKAGVRWVRGSPSDVAYGSLTLARMNVGELRWMVPINRRAV